MSPRKRTKINGRRLTVEDENSLTIRRDGRSVETFAFDIHKYSRVEREIVRVLQGQLARAGTAVHYVDNGMDNSGGLVTDHRMVNSDPDFRDGNQPSKLVEVKTNQYWACQRYAVWRPTVGKTRLGNIKVGNLRNYIRKQACTLFADKEGYFLFSLTAMKRLQTHPVYDFHGLGNKPCHEFTLLDTNQWIKEGLVERFEWDSTAAAEIQRIVW